MPQPGRLWTVEEANGRLDELRELLPELRSWSVRLGQIHEELQRLAKFWGKELDAIDHPDRPLKERLESEWAELRRRLEHEVGRLAEEGIEVKDLEMGLVDFYGLVHEELVLLCWRKEEESVDFFHSLNGGYRNRQPIPDSARKARWRKPPTPA